MYAVIETGGKQYQVRAGDEIFAEKVEGSSGGEVTIDKVLLISMDEDVIAGKPYIVGAKVTAEILKQGKAKKVVVFTYKSKKGEKSKKGHRQPYSKLKITKIVAAE
jgi:large subunit ribosomal protein L21